MPSGLMFFVVMMMISFAGAIGARWHMMALDQFALAVLYGGAALILEAGVRRKGKGDQ